MSDVMLTERVLGAIRGEGGRGRRGALADTYGMKAEALAELMNAYLDDARRREAFRNG